MKNLKKAFLIAIVALTTIFSACSTSGSTTTTPTSANNSFTWTENGGSTILTADNPYANLQGKTIFAVRTGNTIYEINLTSLAVGTYPIGSSNVITYVPNAAGFFNATSGNVIITANAGNKISGTFTGTGSGNGITSVSGQFTNISIQ